MLYDTNKEIKFSSFSVAKKIIIAAVLGGIMLLTTSCALFNKAVDSSTGFSQYLIQTESSIRNEDWPAAKISLADAYKAWKKLKPLIQLDVDHDYVKNIEDDFVRLEAYIETKDKSSSLAAIMLIQNTWNDIDSL